MNIYMHNTAFACGVILHSRFCQLDWRHPWDELCKHPITNSYPLLISPLLTDNSELYLGPDFNFKDVIFVKKKKKGS